MRRFYQIESLIVLEKAMKENVHLRNHEILFLFRYHWRCAQSLLVMSRRWHLDSVTCLREQFFTRYVSEIYEIFLSVVNKLSGSFFGGMTSSAACQKECSWVEVKLPSSEWFISFSEHYFTRKLWNCVHKSSRRLSIFHNKHNEALALNDSD